MNMNEYKILFLLNFFDCVCVPTETRSWDRELSLLSVTKHDFLFLPFKVERTKTPLESKIEEIPGQFLRSVALVGFNVVFNGDFKKMDSLWG